MGKLKILVTLFAIFFVCNNSFAVFHKIVSDSKTILQVSANMMAQTSIEVPHNQNLDTIKSYQNSIKDMSASMLVMKEALKSTLQNISGFGSESKLYQSIFSTTTSIVKSFPVVFKTLNKFPVKNELLCINELTNITLKAKQCISLFKNVVNNGKIDFPIEGNSFFTTNNTEESKGDSYNFLDRYDRYFLAISLLTTLEELKYSLDAIVFMCNYCNSWKDLLFVLDPESWYAYMDGESRVKSIIDDWVDLALI